ncbi:MAG TPA: ATP-binding protein [Bryobacteraceae bacterium]|nr:ATP-binding protein [Bryobacteraceae bacterium]
MMDTDRHSSTEPGTEHDAQWAEFLSRLVHDLREPLRSMHAYSELLGESAQGRLGADGDQALREIGSGAARMRVLLEGLAAYSQVLQESPRALPVMPTSLQSALRIVTANLDDQIRACGGTVTADGLPKVTLSLERAMQLLTALIGNSLRFRSPAPPEIRISAVSADDGMCAISVHDNGIGIAPEDCEAVFKPFMRVEGRKYGGAGLGLTVCRKIVEAQGGTIRMEPGPGGGAVCTFTLPEGD